MKQTFFNATLTVRLPVRVKTAFIRVARKTGRPADVLRDLVSAYSEGRVIIKVKE